ncbi:hypothetical protein QF007_002251 [Clavibacter michiganensis]|nr:hypothetical protein [Clavibacter michiganensis]
MAAHVGVGALAVRTVVFLGAGPRSDAFVKRFDTPRTTLLTMPLRVVVSFRMVSLSGEQVATRFAARAATPSQELVGGGDVQRRLLPQTVPDLPGYEVAGSCVPGGAVSSDFFDWQRTPESPVASLTRPAAKPPDDVTVAEIRQAASPRRAHASRRSRRPCAGRARCSAPRVPGRGGARPPKGPGSSIRDRASSAAASCRTPRCARSRGACRTHRRDGCSS